MPGPESVWKPAKAPPPAGRAALSMAPLESQAAMTAPFGAAPAAGIPRSRPPATRAGALQKASPGPRSA